MDILSRTDVHQHVERHSCLLAGGAVPDDEALLRANPSRLLG